MKNLSILSLLMVMFFSSSVTAAEKDKSWIEYEANSVGVEVVKFPFRVAGGAVGASLGFIKGATSGIYNVWKEVTAKYGAKSHPYLEVPIGLLSLVYAVPVGIISEAPKGAIDLGQLGYDWI